MPKILEELRHEHTNIARMLGVLDQQIAKFEAGGRPDYSLIEAVVEYFRGFADRYHRAKEDLVFARLCEHDPSAARDVGDLAADHRQLAADLDTFVVGMQSLIRGAKLPHETFVHCARDFIDSERRHLAEEEATFYPAAERALTAKDWQELAAGMTELAGGIWAAR